MTEIQREIVFPVGHFAGQRRDLDDAYQVRRGWSPEKLSTSEFSIWVMAHGNGGADTEIRDWTTTDVLERAARGDVDGAEDAMRSLLDRGLLATVPLKPGGQRTTRKFAENHRMGSLLTGLGDTEENPGIYAVGMPNSATTVWLGPDDYETWVWAPLSPSLWSFNEARATMLTELGQRTNATETIGGLLRELRVLVSNSCAFIDVTFARARSDSEDATAVR